jgi:membrane protein required for colicin V production
LDARKYSDELADIISFVALFFVGLFILKQIASWVGTAVKTSFAGMLDRSLGALFGMLRGFVIICIVYMGTTALFPGKKQPAGIRDAQLRPVVHFGAEMITALARALLGDHDGTDAQDLLDRAAEATPTQFIAERLEEEAGALLTKENRKKLDDLIDQVSQEDDKNKEGT